MYYIKVYWAGIEIYHVNVDNINDFVKEYFYQNILSFFHLGVNHLINEIIIDVYNASTDSKLYLNFKK